MSLVLVTPQLAPPILPDQSQHARQQETLLRQRMMDGNWEPDLIEWLRRHVGTTRLQGWQGIDMSANPFRVIVDSLAVLYDGPPTVRNTTGSLEGFTDRKADDSAGLIEAAGLWQTMQTFQARVIGCRQYLMRATVSLGRDGAEARFRMVSPAYVVAWARPEAPDVPVAIAEARVRKCATTYGGPMRVQWTWDFLSIEDPDAPVYTVHTAAAGSDPTGEGGALLGRDITTEVLGVESLSGDAYPYRWADGKPHLPYVLFHARRGRSQDGLFTPFEGRELVRGSLNLAVAWSLWYHLLRDASWPQRFTLNAAPVGGTVDASDGGDEARSHVVTDPATVLILQAIDPEFQQTQVGQWNPGGDPNSMAEALGTYSARLAQDAGLSPTDIQKSSGNARSGYSVAMTNSGKRQQQARFRESFAWGDTQLLAITAAMVNRATAASATTATTDYPERGYSISYQLCPLSPEELRARDEHIVKMMGEGLMSKVQAYMAINPGITREQAVIELAAIEAEKKAPAPAVEPKGDDDDDKPEPKVVVPPVPPKSAAPPVPPKSAPPVPPKPPADVAPKAKPSGGAAPVPENQDSGDIPAANRALSMMQLALAAERAEKQGDMALAAEIREKMKKINDTM